MAMKFSANVTEEVNPYAVSLHTVLDIVKHECAKRIRGDLLNHSNSINAPITVHGPEGFPDKSAFIREFYNRAHQEPHTWRIVFPVQLEFPKRPMSGGLVLEFECVKDEYPRYIQHGIHT